MTAHQELQELVVFLARVAKLGNLELGDIRVHQDVQVVTIIVTIVTIIVTIKVTILFVYTLNLCLSFSYCGVPALEFACTRKNMPHDLNAAQSYHFNFHRLTVDLKIHLPSNPSRQMNKIDKFLNVCREQRRAWSARI